MQSEPFWNILSAEKLYRDGIELVEHDYFDRVSGQTTSLRLRRPGKQRDRPADKAADGSSAQSPSAGAAGLTTAAAVEFQPTVVEVEVAYTSDKGPDIRAIIEKVLANQQAMVADEIVLKLTMPEGKIIGLLVGLVPRDVLPTGLHTHSTTSLQ